MTEQQDAIDESILLIMCEKGEQNIRGSTYDEQLRRPA